MFTHVLQILEKKEIHMLHLSKYMFVFSLCKQPTVHSQDSVIFFVM